jgi:hypothetical protein
MPTSFGLSLLLIDDITNLGHENITYTIFIKQMYLTRGKYILSI